MPTYTDGKITLRTTYGIVYLFRPLIILYEYLYDNYKTNKINKQEQEQKPKVISLLNNIDNNEIHNDLKKLLLVEQNYYNKCNIIQKYNKPEYLSNPNIQEIINFSILYLKKN